MKAQHIELAIYCKTNVCVTSICHCLVVLSDIMHLDKSKYLIFVKSENTLHIKCIFDNNLKGLPFYGKWALKLETFSLDFILKQLPASLRLWLFSPASNWGDLCENQLNKIASLTTHNFEKTVRFTVNFRMWRIFSHILEECKIQCADVLPFFKNSWQKRNFLNFLKSCYFWMSDRRNMIFSMFWDA